MNFAIYDVNMSTVMSYARTLEEAQSLAYSDSEAGLDIAEIDVEEMKDFDDLEARF